MNRDYTIKVAMGKEMQVCPLCKGKGTLPTGSHKSMEDVAGILFSGIMDADLKLRGQKEE